MRYNYLFEINIRIKLNRVNHLLNRVNHLYPFKLKSYI